MKFQSGTRLVVEGDLDAADVTFTEADAGQRWGGVVVEAGGDFTADDATMIKYADVGVRVKEYGAAELRGGSQLWHNTLGAVAEGALTLDAATAEGGDAGVRVYESGSAVIRNGSTVRHNTLGVGVYSDDVLISGSTVRHNGVGLQSDFVTDYCPGLIGCTVGNDRSAFVLDGAVVRDNAAEGVRAYNTDASIRFTDIADNGGYGFALWNADVETFYENTVSGNGDHGVHLLDNGSLEMKGGPGGIGSDCITANGDDEVWVDLNAFFFAGDGKSGGQNTIKDTDLDGDTFLIYREADPIPAVPLPAEEVFWGTGGAAPAGAFNPNANVNAASALSADPACNTGSRLSGEGLATAGRLASDGGEADHRGEAARGREELRQAIRRLRQRLQQNPGADDARGVLRALYTLQRRDRADALGEHAPTMALLAVVRGRLGPGNLPAPLRAAAEAALVAELADALRHGDYAAADELVALHGSSVEGEQARESVALHAAMADAAAGRFGAALARVDAVLATLGEEETEKAEGLARVAESLAARVGDGARGAGSGGAATGAPTDAAARSGAEVFGRAVEAFALAAPYPNPAAGTLTVPVALDARAEVRIAVYDVLGREVAVLADGPIEAGQHALVLDASALPAGAYLVRAASAGRVLTHPVTVVR